LVIPTERICAVSRRELSSARGVVARWRLVVAVEVVDTAGHALLGRATVQKFQRSPDDLGATFQTQQLRVAAQLGGEVVPDPRLPGLRGSRSRRHAYTFCRTASAVKCRLIAPRLRILGFSR